MDELEHNRSNWIKRHLPASLFARAFLIMIVPMLLVQAIAIHVFYVQHWENVERHFASYLAGDVGFIVNEMKKADEKRRSEIRTLALHYMHIEIFRDQQDDESMHFPSITDDTEFEVLVKQLKKTIKEPFLIHRSVSKDRAILLIRLDNSVLRLQFSMKRIASVNAMIFIIWTVGSALLLMTVATLFLRNQIRPIKKLAEVAEKFGKGQDDVAFRPQGASEIRQAGRSFLAMRERLKRIIAARTEMLASISHDLRTPLTRMRLALAMLPEQKYVKPLLADVSDMETMIQEYLDFARGKGGEQAQQVKVKTILEMVVDKYQAQGKQVTLDCTLEISVALFYNAMCRCFYNIIDNALRYGGNYCAITVLENDRYLEIIFDDKGQGIAQAERDLAMQPFKRLDISRNQDTSGAGLGLSIVQDIVLRHGGHVLLEDAPTGGLRVKIKLPK